MNTVHVCDYGCGQESHYQMKNGKWCCSKSVNSCPSARKRNSLSVTKAHKEGKILTKETREKLSKYEPWNKGKILKPKILHPGKCEYCGKEHDGSYGSGRFCCQSCANTWVLLYKRNKSIGSVTKEKAILKYNNNPKKCIICGKDISYERRNCKTCCKECTKQHLKENQSEINKKIQETYKRNGTHPGGYHKGSGYGKKGWYKGYWCDCSWELAFTIYNIDHDIKFERYDSFFEYQFHGQIFKYYPDYIMEDGSLLEIKGRDNEEQWLAKLNSIPSSFSIKVLTWKDIQPYIKYAIQKYGKNFTDLYEKRENK